MDPVPYHPGSNCPMRARLIDPRPRLSAGLVKPNIQHPTLSLEIRIESGRGFSRLEIHGASLRVSYCIIVYILPYGGFLKEGCTPSYHPF